MKARFKSRVYLSLSATSREFELLQILQLFEFYPKNLLISSTTAFGCSVLKMAFRFTWKNFQIANTTIKTAASSPSR